MADATDAELLAACRKGDRGAFGAIVERYQRAVRAVTYAGTGDATLGEDLAQDTFVTAWRRLDSIEDVARLPAWLCGIARNLARSARRTRGREIGSDELEIAGDSTPFDAVSERETELVVASALARVPDTYREPLVLFYYEQRSVDDVARALGISADTVHQRLSRGRRFLADGVTALIEHTLERRRPRRDLAAAVVAAIAVTAGASHVEASTTKGSIMWKLGLSAGALAVVAGAGYMVNRAGAGTAGDGSAIRATASATASPSAIRPTSTSSGASASASARTTKPGTGSPAGTGAGTERRAGAPSLTAAPSITYDCHDVAEHVAVCMHGQPDTGNVTHFEQQCRDEHWNQDFMACLMNADDMIGAHLDCLKLAHDDGAPAQPVAAASLDDLSCAAVGAHTAQVAHSGSFSGKLGPHLAKICEEGAWPESRRRCMLLATDTGALDTCE